MHLIKEDKNSQNPFFRDNAGARWRSDRLFRLHLRSLHLRSIDVFIFVLLTLISELKNSQNPFFRDNAGARWRSDRLFRPSMKNEGLHLRSIDVN